MPLSLLSEVSCFSFNTINFINRKKYFAPLLLLLILYLFNSNNAFSYSIPINPADTANLEVQILGKIEEVLQSGNTTDQLNEEDLKNLPIGIVKNIAGIQYVIVVDSVNFTPEGAFLNFYTALKFGEQEETIAFAATNIIFHPQGLSASESTHLELVSQERIPIGEHIELVIPADGNTFVEFDCNGFKSVNLKGVFEFSRDIVIPIDSKPKVTAAVEGNFTDLNNILASISIDPFKPKNAKDLVIEVNTAFIDFSDISNPINFTPPEGYLGIADLPNLWRGFFIKKARVILPKKLNPEGDTIKIDAQNMIIDKNGFSGMVGATGIFNKEEGSLNGWPMSIDSIGVQIVENQLIGGAFKGEIVVPPFDQESPLNYTAIIQTDDNDEQNYLFSISPSGDISASALMATVVLEPNSTIIVEEIDGQFKPRALLHGRISITAGEKLALRELKFENLDLNSESPLIRGGTWSLTSQEEQKVGSFPISISTLNVTHDNDDIKLTVQVLINLMNKEDMGFAASTDVSVEGKLVEEMRYSGEEEIAVQKWEYVGTKINAASIDYESQAISIYGSVNFYENNATFGNGFRGEIDASFVNGRYQMKAIGQFGKVSGNKYWYVDAMMKFSPPLGNGFGLYGLGGGAYYHMTIEEPLINEASAYVTVSGKKDSLMIGDSRSEVRYIPDSTIGLGFKASVIVGLIPSAKTFNGMATFEMRFFDGGGIEYIGFLGEAFFMQDIGAANESSKMYATLDIDFDFENDVLHGVLDTYINAGNFLRGSYAKGHVGSAVIHIDPDDWYLHVGNPDQRISLDILGTAQIGAYFMVGTYIHDFPSVADVIPDGLISSIQDDLDGFMRDENSLSAGGGIAFGASLAIGAQRKTFLIFYGQFNAGLGFDVMLRDYGSASCEGWDGPIGINGWYASGQAWLYLNGEIGITVNTNFIKGEFAIMEVSLASIIQAKLPNPTMVNGYVVGKYDILGGLVKGNFDFKVSIGEECEFITEDALDLQVIAEMQPSSSEAVDVFTAPQVAFNVPVNTEFNVFNELAEENRKYKVSLDFFKIYKGQNEIEGSLEFNNEKNVVVYKPFEILPPQSEITANVKVTWNEFKDGSWEIMGGDNPLQEEEEITFNTGDAPTYIPEHNIAFSYPTTGMSNFHIRESGEGYITLMQGQDYLFNNNGSFEYVGRYNTSAASNFVEVPLTYDTDAKTILFPILETLENEQAYLLSVVKKPKNVLVVDDNVTQTEKILHSSEKAEIVVNELNIETVLILEEEQVIYETYFATSKYNTFVEKINAQNWSFFNTYLEAYTMGLIGLGANASEGFDELEINGNSKTSSLVQFLAKTDNPYFEKVNLLIYKDYPVRSNLTIDWRNPSILGVPPLKAFSITQDATISTLSKEEIFLDRDDTERRVYLTNEMAFISMNDFSNLNKKAYEHYDANTAPSDIRNLMFGEHTGFLHGVYNFDIRYILPGKTTPTSIVPLTINNK